MILGLRFKGEGLGCRFQGLEFSTPDAFIAGILAQQALTLDPEPWKLKAKALAGPITLNHKR
jgi:hypothetical protein